jgi:hypothetical protein
MPRWQIGERVTYMGSPWRVVSRRSGPTGTLTVQLATDPEWWLREPRLPQCAGMSPEGRTEITRVAQGALSPASLR